MPAAPGQKTILVASRDRRQADVRRRVLEDAGYRVVPVFTVPEIAQACRAGKIDVALIGYSLPTAEKRRVVHEIRKLTRKPILLLHQGDPPDISERGLIFHRVETPEDFLHTIDVLMKRARRGAGAA